MQNETQKDRFILDRDYEKPAQTPEEEAMAALDRLSDLTYDAVARLEKILENRNTPENARLLVINMILERVYGRPEEMLKLHSNELERQASTARINAIAAQIGTKKAATLEHSNTRNSTEGVEI